MGTVKDMLEAKRKKEEGTPPDYWILFEIYYSDNTREDVLGKDWNVASEENYLYIWDVSRLADGASRPPLRMVNLTEVRMVKLYQQERVKRMRKTKNGKAAQEEEFIYVNVEFPCRTAKASEGNEIEVPPWEDDPEEAKGGEEQVGGDSVQVPPSEVPEG